MPWKKLPCPTCPGERNYNAKQCRACAVAAQSAKAAHREILTPAALVKRDQDLQRLNAQLRDTTANYKTALDQLDSLRKQLHVTQQMETLLDTFVIEPRKTGAGSNEATVVAPASDWHVEEVVDPRTVSGLNAQTPEISKKRATNYFQNTLRLTRLLQQDIAIHNLVMPLLGDFISNDIHEEFPETNAEAPMHAIGTAQSYLISGIEFLLNHSKLQLSFPCHSGNHGRTTRTTRFGMENGHSLEFLMYRHMADYFRTEPRVKFDIAPGPHSYMSLYGRTLRFHHGHMIKYGGGVGGIFIPTYKAIAQWNKARPADLDIFGHFHQRKDGGNFICNGSLIGYNSYALSIKADYEQPAQQLLLMDKKRGRTCVWPVFV